MGPGPRPALCGGSARPVDGRRADVDGRSRDRTTCSTVTTMGRRPLPLTPSLLAASARMHARAVGQGGVITAAQCRRLSIDDHGIRRLLGAGLWTRARHGIYADTAFSPASADPVHHTQCAALLASL